MLLVLAIVASLVVAALGIVAGRKAGAGGQRWARWLRWAALAVAVVAAAVLTPAAARDAGWFAAVLLGVPVVLPALPVAWDLIAGRPAPALDWLAAIAAMVWAILLALGIGLAFIPAALLQLAAAATTTAARPTPVASAE